MGSLLVGERLNDVTNLELSTGKIYQMPKERTWLWSREGLVLLYNLATY